MSPPRKVRYVQVNGRCPPAWSPRLSEQRVARDVPPALGAQQLFGAPRPQTALAHHDDRPVDRMVEKFGRQVPGGQVLEPHEDRVGHGTRAEPDVEHSTPPTAVGPAVRGPAVRGAVAVAASLSAATAAPAAPAVPPASSTVSHADVRAS